MLLGGVLYCDTPYAAAQTKYPLHANRSGQLVVLTKEISSKYPQSRYARQLVLSGLPIILCFIYFNDIALDI